MPKAGIITDNAPSGVQSSDVHTVLGRKLNAYSVFTPRPDLRLFQAILLNHPSPYKRYASPFDLGFNLKDILKGIRYHLVDPSFASDLGTELPHEDPPPDNPWPLLFGDAEPEIEASEASCLTAMAAAAAPVGPAPVPAPLGARFRRQGDRAASLKLSDFRVSKYTGYDLSRLLWRNRDAFFRCLLLYIDKQLGTTQLKRDLLAIVTKGIKGVISVSSLVRTNTQGGLFVSLFSCCFGKDRGDQRTTLDSGVAGIHFVLLPVERTGDYKYTFYEPIKCVNPEPEDVLLRGATEWATKPEETLRYGENTLKVENIEVRSPNAPSTTASSRAPHVDRAAQATSSPPEEDIQSCQPISKDAGERNVHPHSFEVDISQSLEAFALQQCALARIHRDAGTEDRFKELAFQMFQSAADKGCRPAMRELADCYRRGIGTPVDSDRAAELLRQADAALGTVVERQPGERVAGDPSAEHQTSTTKKGEVGSESISILFPRDELKGKERNGQRRKNRNKVKNAPFMRKHVRVEAVPCCDTTFYAPDNVVDYASLPVPTQNCKVDSKRSKNLVAQGDPFEISFVGMNVAPQDLLFGDFSTLLFHSLKTVDYIEPNGAESVSTADPSAAGPLYEEVAAKTKSEDDVEIHKRSEYARKTDITSSDPSGQAKRVLREYESTRIHRKQLEKDSLRQTEVPIIHFDPDLDGFDGLGKPGMDTFLPVPASKGLYFSSIRDDNLNHFLRNAVIIRFQLMMMDRRTTLPRAAKDGSTHAFGFKGGQPSEIGEFLHQAYEVASVLGKKNLRTYSRPSCLMNWDYEFLIAEARRDQDNKGDSTEAPRQEYLQYGYYFFLSKPVEARLYANIGATSRYMRLMMRRQGMTEKMKAKGTKEYLNLTDVSYVVMRVTRGVSQSRNWTRGEVNSLYQRNKERIKNIVETTKAMEMLAKTTQRKAFAGISY